MAGSLRSLAVSARRALQGQLPPSAGLQKRRALGDLPYKPNKYIEDWGTAREHIELTFKWDGKTLRTIALWMVLGL
ncbi:hypothetical protein WJX81_008411 [Elliptochloris bilobata]|uniref:Uncharacterized protein n=1 Tax=Elliptochloris bilobata TaxID=381761 RepID=A0AAW1S7P9_9CHLO